MYPIKFPISTVLFLELIQKKGVLLSIDSNVKKTLYSYCFELWTDWWSLMFGIIDFAMETCIQAFSSMLPVYVVLKHILYLYTQANALSSR